MDGRHYGEEETLGPGTSHPLIPPQHHDDYYFDEHRQYDHFDEHHYVDHPSYSSSPPTPHHPLAANSQALAANDAVLAATLSSPDDFYRAQMANMSFQGPQSSSTTTPFSSSRSASNPVHDKPAASGGARPAPSAVKNGYSGAAHQSVRDLKKKFDQSVPPPPASSDRRPTNRTRPSRGVSSSPANPETRPPLGKSKSDLPRTTERRGRPRGDGQQQPKLAPHDHPSSSQSFASRIGRPRNAISPSPKAPDSMASSLAPPGAPHPPSSPSSSRELLFGEIAPDSIDARTAGFGIDAARPRRTSESQLSNPKRPHQRSLSDPDEPSSPTDWYRASPLSRQNTGTTPESKIPRLNSHPKALGSRSTSSTRRRPTPSGDPPTSPSSLLPRSITRFGSSASNRGSPASTRSNSPAATKRPPAAPPSGRTSRQQIGPPPASKTTPTKRSATPTTRSKTPTTRKSPPRINTAGNNRLNAYVSAPPPKLSPPLRSSRPRQSVATATTASSRMKAVDNSNIPLSPRKKGRETPSSDDAASSRRHKITVGPIDFAQRRETIKLAYSKSIRESQARQAREAAAEQRKKELEAVARAKAEAEAAMAEGGGQRRPTLSLREEDEEGEGEGDKTVEEVEEEKQVDKAEDTVEKDEVQEAHTEEPRPLEHRPLTIATSPPIPTSPPPPGNPDSPTLGMPGSFPIPGSPPTDQVPPHSAASVTSAVTEFDLEPQTEPPTQGASSASPSSGLGILPSPRTSGTVAQEPRSSSLSLHRKASYHYPFDAEGHDEGVESIHEGHDDSVSIKISLDTSVPQSPQPTPTLESHQPPIPGSFQEYEPEPEEYQPQKYEPQQQPQGRPQEHGPQEQPREYEQEYQPQDQPQEYEQEYPPQDQPQYQPHDSCSPYDEEEAAAIRIPTLDATPRVQDVTPTRNDEGDSRVDADASTTQNDAHHTSIDSLAHVQDFYARRPNMAALRDSTVSSSDHDASLDGQLQRTPDTSHSLTVPVLLSPGNRLSQASVWTDFSFGSVDDREGKQDAPTQHPPIRSVPVDPKLSSHDSSYEYIPRDPDVSPSDPVTIVNIIQPPAIENEHRLPELDTGAGFSVSYPPGEPAPSPLPPDHSPPPLPDEFQLDDSAYYVETRPSSYLHDEPDEYGQAISTPHSLELEAKELPDPPRSAGLDPGQSAEAGPGQGSETGTTPSGPVAPPSDKEKKRLKQRLLVIKELVDTESAFVRDMSVVEEIYKGTAEACPNLDAKTVKLIFRNTDEIIAFHSAFLAQLRDGASSVYTAKGRRSPLFRQDSSKDDLVYRDSDAATVHSTLSSGGASSSAKTEQQPDDARDRQTSLGTVFSRNLEAMKTAHEGYLRTSDHANKRLIQIQEDPTVKVWLNECNEVAKDLTAAWNLDSLLIKPMQRLTKYPNLLVQMLEHTPADHPDREALLRAKTAVEDAILDINKTKKNFELVGQIVGRKRKESEVRAGLARAFGKRVDKLQQTSSSGGGGGGGGSRGAREDDEYGVLCEKFGDDYLRLQVVLRDVEYYTRTTSTYVHEFLQYLSSMELVMRLQPSKHHGHLESKWVQFNVGMRDIEKVLEQHLMAVRKQVIEPFEQVIRCYGNPSLAMKKRTKRRLDYEKSMQLKAGGKKVDKQLAELVEQYEALNETLKKELPKLSALTARVGNICLAKLVLIQTEWYAVWKEKVKVPLQDSAHVPEFADIIPAFQADFRLIEEEALAIGILNPKGRTSQSTTDDASSTFSRSRPRPPDLVSRGRGTSVNSDSVPSLPTPDILKRSSGQFALSPTLSSPNHYYYRDYYAGINHSRGEFSPAPSSDTPAATRSVGVVSAGRPSTGLSYDSGAAGVPRPSTESAAQPSLPSPHQRRDSGSTYNSPPYADGTRRFSGLFHSALPLPDASEEAQRSSRSSSHDRGTGPRHNYNVLWLAASLFEFNIETTKHEAGYPYLTYQAGEIFDVIAEKGELWLAKNQDDPHSQVGWIWSKHFAKLADP